MVRYVKKFIKVIIEEKVRRKGKRRRPKEQK